MNTIKSSNHQIFESSNFQTISNHHKPHQTIPNIGDVARNVSTYFENKLHSNLSNFQIIKSSNHQIISTRHKQHPTIPNTGDVARNVSTDFHYVQSCHGATIIKLSNHQPSAQRS